MNALKNQVHCWLDRRPVIKHPKSFIRPIQLSRPHVPAEAARLAESLCLRKIGLAAPQLPRRPFLFGYIHQGANESDGLALFDYRTTNTVDKPKRTVGSHDPLLNIAANPLGNHVVQNSFDEGPVLRLYEFDVIRKHWKPLGRIKSKDAVELWRQVIEFARRQERPASGMGKRFTLLQTKLAPPQLSRFLCDSFFSPFSVFDVD